MTHAGLNARIGRIVEAPVHAADTGRAARAAPAAHADRRSPRRTRLRALLVGALLVAAALVLGASITRSSAGERSVAVESAGTETSPVRHRDQPLTQAPPGEFEQRLAHRFDGAIVRYTEGEQVVVVRTALRPTRHLVASDEALRAIGYRVDRPQVWFDARGERWSCFVAERGGLRTRACERFHDGGDGRWTDAAAWFWASQYGGGPWWAVTTFTPVNAD